jgi:alpha/beta superfamily hydrolase
MLRIFHILAWVITSLLLFAACGGPAAPIPTTGQATPGPRSVTFTTEDGLQLSGTLYGQGTAAIIFSHMSDGSRAEWRDLPEKMAGMGYMALAYDFRGRGDSEGTFDPPASNKDLMAAVNFIRDEGAQKIALIGASMGAMASAKVAAVEKTEAVICLAGGISWSGPEISDQELAAISAPLLVITSEEDQFVQDTLHIYEVASSPKEKHLYPGRTHGTDLFDTHGADLSQRIINFILKNMSL